MNWRKLWDKLFPVFLTVYLGWIFYSVWREDGWSGVFYMTLFTFGVGLVVIGLFYIGLDWYLKRRK